jgi:hypothetical protein
LESRILTITLVWPTQCPPGHISNNGVCAAQVSHACWEWGLHLVHFHVYMHLLELLYNSLHRLSLPRLEKWIVLAFDSFDLMMPQLRKIAWCAGGNLCWWHFSCCKWHTHRNSVASSTERRTFTLPQGKSNYVDYMPNTDCSPDVLRCCGHERSQSD